MFVLCFWFLCLLTICLTYFYNLTYLSNLIYLISYHPFFLFNTIFVSSHMYPENPEGTQVIRSRLNEHGIYIYISDTAMNRTHNLFRPKPISLTDTPALRRLRSATRGDLIIPSSKTVRFGPRSFNVSRPTLWNSWPVNIRQCKSFESFKKQLKTFLYLRQTVAKKLY